VVIVVDDIVVDKVDVEVVLYEDDVVCEVDVDVLLLDVEVEDALDVDVLLADVDVVRDAEVELTVDEEAVVSGPSTVAMLSISTETCRSRGTCKVVLCWCRGTMLMLSDSM